MPKDKPIIVKPTAQQVKQHGNLPEEPPLVPLSSGDKKPRGWYIYTKQAVCIANSRGVAKGITASKKKKARPTGAPVRAVVITDPHYVDYNPPPEPPVELGPVFRRNPFELHGPTFIDSSSVEEPAHACDPKVLRRR
jgi:hypothetical protein